MLYRISEKNKVYRNNTNEVDMNNPTDMLVKLTEEFIRYFDFTDKSETSNSGGQLGGFFSGFRGNDAENRLLKLFLAKST